MLFQAINWQVTFIKWPNSQHAQKVKQNTSPESRILKLFDALDSTSAMYHCKPLVQAQHRPSAKIQELSTNDLSFTLDGVLSTLQQGSAENGVGSPVELRYHVKKRRAQICDQIQRFIKIPTGLHRKTRTPNASAERIVANLITLKHCRVKKTVSPSTSTCWRRTPSFRSRRNTISHRETQTKEENKEDKEKCSLCRSVLCQVKWHSSSCSLNELLTPVLRADVSTGKLDSRFPVNKPQVSQNKVCWNNSSCYKSTNSLLTIETLPKVLKANWFIQTWINS